MKKLRLNKNDALYLHIVRSKDSSSKTYNIISQAFIVREGERLFLSDYFGNAFRIDTSIRHGYDNCYELVKPLIEKMFNLKIEYYIDHKNIIVSESWAKPRSFNKHFKMYEEMVKDEVEK